MTRIRAMLLILVGISGPAYAASNTVLSVDALMDRFVLSKDAAPKPKAAPAPSARPGPAAGLALQESVVAEITAGMLSSKVDDVEWHLERAHRLLISQRPLEAAAEYTHILRRDPDHRGAMEGLGLCFARLGNDRGAHAVLTSLLQAFPDAARYQLQMAAVHYRMGAYEKALELLQAVEAEDFRYEQLYLGGLLAYAQGRHVPAVRMLHTAVESAPDQDDPLKALAEIYASMGNRKATLRILGHLEKRLGPASYTAFTGLPVFYEYRKKQPE